MPGPIPELVTQEIRVRGRVQGVGFRPFVWRLARRLSLDGHVLNDSAGVQIVVRGDAARLRDFVRGLNEEVPPLARISTVEAQDSTTIPAPGFLIAASAGGAQSTEISPDYATCPDCRAEISDPADRRHRYAFTNCTHCGPRLTIIRALPYDRPQTTMADFPLCVACAGEYADPGDRRFHAEPIACPACGPHLLLERWASARVIASEPVAGAQQALRAGEIIAVKALGGYQLAVDATNAAAVLRLRSAKKRDGKPFAMMARDLATVTRYAEVSGTEAEALEAREAPILLLRALPGQGLAEAVAPGLATLGFMLPSNPLQMLLLETFDTPLVMTSGNLSGDPQITADAEARSKLGGIAGFALTHNRAIANRIDDSVAREMGGALRLIRRARGYAPAALPLPAGFQNAPDLISYGADLKSTFCIVAGGQAQFSGHMGDLESTEAIGDFETSLRLYNGLYAPRPEMIVADLHEGYVSTRLARVAAETEGLPLRLVQHHHAHLAAVMGENGAPLGESVIGIVLDGIGAGDDGTFWGAEILFGSYDSARRLGGLKPSPLPGGDAAAREPWRNLYAALATHVGWEQTRILLAGQDVLARLEAKPLSLMNRMMAVGLNAPSGSSCGRLFDAVAAAAGCAFERQQYEGEAATLLETLCERQAEGSGYPFGIVETEDFVTLDPAPFWRALLADIAGGRPARNMARDFHAGLMTGLCRLVQRIAAPIAVKPRVVLAGGSFMNRLLFEGMMIRLQAAGFEVLTPRILPANDGGIAYGQALVAAARHAATPPT